MLCVHTPTNRSVFPPGKVHQKIPTPRPILSPRHPPPAALPPHQCDATLTTHPLSLPSLPWQWQCGTFFVSTKSPSDMVSCRQDTAPSADHTRRWNDMNIGSIPWTIWWYRFSAGQGQLMKILIYFWWAAKTIAGSYTRVTMGKLIVWALKLDPSLHQDTKWKPTSRAFDGVIIMGGFRCKILLY